MINLHNVIAVTPGDINTHDEGRHSRVIVIKTSDHGRIELNLFADSYEALDTPGDALAHHWRTQAAEWQDRHAELYLMAEKYQQRAESAERRLAALQELLHKACDASGERVGGSVRL